MIGISYFNNDGNNRLVVGIYFRCYFHYFLLQNIMITMYIQSVLLNDLLFNIVF